mmetsp:Transcript_129416/g.242155  ORF Transcript_129416/g.242155 Transcript_129416/m.242155 type:complete len:88 (+) Transcript_129416:312-575(+)
MRLIRGPWGSKSKETDGFTCAGRLNSVEDCEAAGKVAKVSGATTFMYPSYELQDGMQDWERLKRNEACDEELCDGSPVAMNGTLGNI